MNTKSIPRPAARKHPPLWLEFLGSMNLAIALLVTVAIASVVGTVLKQNEPYQNYIIKFGPFWHEVFLKLGLYDVYSAGWFLFILAFLVVSTSVCIYRNAPKMVRDIWHYRLNLNVERLRLLKHVREFESPLDPEQVEARLRPLLQRQGYRLRVREQQDGRIIAAKKGAINRLGYLFTHSAIVIICVGGLVDGNIGLKLKALSGEIKPETRDIPASQVPPISWLPRDNPSFRGNVSIPEGSSADLVFLQLRDGYLVQPLPFSIKLKDFRVEYYSTGQPKSFESDLVIEDDSSSGPVEATIAVNHPLIYKGYAIYQASFQDGGSKLTFKAWPLDASQGQPQTFSTAVSEDMKVETSQGPLTLEMDDFRLFNINPAPEGSGKKFRNFGPSVQFKLRNAQGEAREYENYMSPIELEGRAFYLSGVRSQVSEPFSYLHIPADPQGSLARFMAFDALLHDPQQVAAVARDTAAETFSEMQLKNDSMQEEVVQTMVRLAGVFTAGGFDAIGQLVEESVPAEKRARVADAYMKVLQNLLSSAYVRVLQEEGVDVENGVSDADARFYEDAINAVAAIPAYGSPFYLQLTGFEHLQAAGLQIAKAPGKATVYLGFFLLCAGVFMMFYIHPRRLWLMLIPEGDKTRVLLAGSGERNPREFDTAFARLSQQADALLNANLQRDSRSL